MKKLYFLSFTLCLFTSVNAQIINIPDANFKAALLEANTSNLVAKDVQGNPMIIDSNTNGEIEVSEALNVYTLDVSDRNISNLTGIGYFTNLTNLNCFYNQITSLNLSGLSNLTELVCRYNQLTSLNLTGLSNLEVLNCETNQLTSLNLTGLSNLTELSCSGNQLTSLNLTGLSNLIELSCSGNQFTSLNLAGLSNLKELYCGWGPLTSLNLTGLTNLEVLYCSGNQFTSLNLTELSNLKEFYCHGGQFTSLNLTGLSNLTKLTCTYSQLTSLDLTGLSNLTELNCDGSPLTSLNLTGLTNLKSLGCTNNQLSSLNLTGLTNLQSLQCFNNQLTSLNLTGLSNLIDFDCFNNKLSSLNLAGLSNLISLACPVNQLTSLNLAGLTNLQYLECSHNQLASLNLAGLSNLQYLSCYENQLTSLNLTGLSNLAVLGCNNNQLTSLDVTEMNGLVEDQWGGFTYYIECSDNPLLESIFQKNGNNHEGYINFYNCPNLVYICTDDFRIDQIQSQINDYGYKCEVNSYCSFTPGGDFYTIKGLQKLDSDTNGCDALDLAVPNLKFTISDGVKMGSLISNTSGAFSIPVQAGTHTITPVLENPTYFTIFPISTTVEFPIQTSPFTQDFCITPNGSHSDLEVTILPIIMARPGFDAKYSIIYKNKGNTTESGAVTLSFNDAILDFVSANPAVSNQISNSLSWGFINLLPFETREIDLTLNVNSPTEIPAVTIGDILVYNATINSSAIDETPNDTVFTFNQTVVGSIDPNDKTCLEGTTISQDMIGEYVYYVIRFENSGTYPAKNIVVKDMIDAAKFDVTTLVPINGSHSFVTRITEGNKVEFIFENINLPFDDAANDGFVAFKIKTKPTLVVGDSFDNNASIYFDYNFPVVTNTAKSTIQTLKRQDFEFSFYFSLYPNPVTTILNFAVKNNIEVKSITIYNTLGQLVLVIPNAQTVSKIDVSQLKSGNYFIKMNTDKGTANTKFIKM